MSLHNKSLKVLKSLLFLVLGMLSFEPPSFAVPMVRSTKGDFDGSGVVTIYSDHEDPNLFYFLPNTGSFAISKSGMPLVSLIHKGLSDPDPTKGAGYFTAVFEAGISSDVRTSLLTFKSRHPDSRLSVIPFGQSTVSIGNDVMINEDSALVPDPGKNPPAPMDDPNSLENMSGLSFMFRSLYLPKSAGVAESQVGMTAILTQDGALLMKAAIEGLNPLNLNLCFEIHGALPKMDARITMDYQRIYQYFAASARVGWLWWGWSIEPAVEQLIEDKSISIEILGGDAKDEDYIKAIAKELMETYLQPKLGQLDKTSHYVPANFLIFTLKSNYQEQRTKATFRIKKQSYVTDDRCIALPLGPLTEFKDKIVKSADF